MTRGRRVAILRRLSAHMEDGTARRAAAAPPLMIDLIRLSVSDWLGLPHETGTPEEHLYAAMRWLCRAEDMAQGGGVARGYTLKYQSTYKKAGWLPPYPETTGYIIETFYDFGARTNQATYAERARRMAKWESEVQMESGAVQGAV